MNRGLGNDPSRAAAWLAVGLGVVYAAWTLASRLSPALDFDAQHIYLPFARRLIEAAPDFLRSEQSLYVAPFSYVYPALLRADPATIKFANIALFLALIGLTYRIGLRLHSRLAGVMAALLLAASPSIKPYVPTALTEPPFLFLTGTWLWAIAEGQVSRRTGWWIVAGVALGLAILTRPTYLYFAPAALAVSATAWYARRGTDPGIARGLVIVHAIAFAMALLAIARNAWLFDYASISTGTGAALYFGSNPMTGGYDSGYLGIVFDDGSVTLGKHHLSIEGDRLLRGVAMSAIADMRLSDLAAMYGGKLAAFVFVTQAETTADPEVLRSWRLGLLVCALYGWMRVREPALRLFLAGVLAYQVCVHIPLMYNYRYSVGALDLPLTFLAGTGVAAALASARRIAVLLAACGLAIVLGLAHARQADLPSPDPVRTAHVPIWRADYEPALGGRPIEVEVRDAPLLHSWDHVVLALDVSVRRDGGARCRGMNISYRRKGDQDFAGPAYRRFVDDGSVRQVRLGARLVLELNAEGMLRIDPDCDPGAELRLHAARIASGRFATYYRERYLRLPPTPGVVPPPRS